MSEKIQTFITFGNNVLHVSKIAYFEISLNIITIDKYYIICHFVNHKKIIKYGNFASKLSAHIYLNNIYHNMISNKFVSIGNDYIIREDFILYFSVSNEINNANTNETNNVKINENVNTKTNEKYTIMINITNNTNNANSKFLTWGSFNSTNDALVHINKNILQLFR